MNHCKYFVVRKKRFCRMTVKSGYDYCGEHQPKLEQTENINEAIRVRIPCPLDNKHTCYANKLSKHLKKCNVNVKTIPPYISHGINLEDKRTEETRQLGNVPIIQILNVIEKVNELYKDLIESSITTKVLKDDILTNELMNPNYGQSACKHLLQTSSLIGHLKEAGLIQQYTCYVEFGAGKGQLSYWISKVINSVVGTSVLLVERASLRHKLDNKLDKTENCVHRIRADIADLVLQKVDVVSNSKRIVGVTKHLCGEATDLALRCMMNAMNQEDLVKGLVMSFCCHHRCHWSSYTGKQFFIQNSLTKTDFDIICGLVSWATCGTGKSRDKRNKIENDETLQLNNVTQNRYEEIGLKREEREQIGKRCKQILDYGRLVYLNEHKFTCKLHYYVEPSVTLENVCIVAIKS